MKEENKNDGADFSGLTREALEQSLEIKMIQHLILQEKMDIVKKEMAQFFCAVEENRATTEQIKKGIQNIIFFIDSKQELDEVLDKDNKMMDLINKYQNRVIDFNLSLAKEKKKESKGFVVYTNKKFAMTEANLHVSNKKYLSEKQFLAENDNDYYPVDMIVKKEDFDPKKFLI